MNNIYVVISMSKSIVTARGAYKTFDHAKESFNLTYRTPLDFQEASLTRWDVFSRDEQVGQIKKCDLMEEPQAM